MTRTRLSYAVAAVALLGLAACETTEQTAADETIQWNAPRPETQPAPPPASPPGTPPSGAASEPQCREYQTTIMIGGKPQKAYGRACRQPDGTWKEMGVSDTPKEPGNRVEQSYPYGWYGYDYPSGPRYGPGGMSIGVGAGSRGGWFGYGVGF
jgi:hypothetical protein